MEINLLNTATMELGQAKATQASENIYRQKSKAAAQEAAETFEAIFISQMLAPMFETIKTDGPMGGGHAEKIYRSMQIEKFGETIVNNGGIGIAENIMRDILAAQEV